MIAIAKKCHRRKNHGWHRQFLEMLPAIERHASFAFRRLSAEDRDDAVAEVIASSFCAFHRLVELGKQDLAYAGALARFAVAQFRSGRRVGTQFNSRDVLSRAARQKHDLRLHYLGLLNRTSAGWMEALVDNRCTTVADQAAFRLDFPAWLTKLDHRNRQVAQFLMLGNSTISAGRQFRLTAGRISQIRSELRQSWIGFHGLQPWESVTFARKG